MSQILDIERLLQDYNVDYNTSGTKVSSGWIGVHCPFCAGKQGYHLGYNTTRPSGYWHCWRCGGHPTADVLLELIGVPIKEQRKAFRMYLTRGFRAAVQRQHKHEAPASLSLPAGSMPLTPRHKAYLEGRGFDAEHLEKLYDLKATGISGRLRFRILAPIYDPTGRRMVSYQARDITDRQQAKYLPCLKEDELVPHKECLYARHLVRGTTAIVVEGITDAWSIGPGAVATFGIKYTARQVLALRGLKRVFVLYDPEPQAQHQALKLAREASLLGIEAHVHEGIEGRDPGQWTREEVRNLRRELYIK